MRAKPDVYYIWISSAILLYNTYKYEEHLLWKTWIGLMLVHSRAHPDLYFPSETFQLSNIRQGPTSSYTSNFG